jgi:mRNA-degrading endonuclease toxin of MazEF toxin-antitoxin module
MVLGTDDGLPHESAIRCDFLMVMFKAKLTQRIATLSPTKSAKLHWR